MPRHSRSQCQTYLLPFGSLRLFLPVWVHYIFFVGGVSQIDKPPSLKSSHREAVARSTRADLREELRATPDLVATKLCFQWSSKGRCKKGSACTFAHGASILSGVRALCFARVVRSSGVWCSQGFQSGKGLGGSVGDAAPLCLCIDVFIYCLEG